jgi:hypothetical protein
MWRTEGYLAEGFRGYIDTLRISRVARYVGGGFAPRDGDLPSDANTVLLYQFDEAADATVVNDLSGSGRHGQLVAWLPGASPPPCAASRCFASSPGLELRARSAPPRFPSP